MQYDNNSTPPIPIATARISISANKAQSVDAPLVFDTRSGVTVLPDSAISQLRDLGVSLVKVKVTWIDELTKTPRQRMGYWVIIEFPEEDFISKPIKIITDEVSVGKIGRDLMEYLVVKLDGPLKNWNIIN